MAMEETVAVGWKSLLGVLGASITKDLDLFKDQIISDQMYLVGDTLVVTTEGTEIRRAFGTETGTDTMSRHQETAGNGTKIKTGIETETEIGTEKRKKKGIDLLKRRKKTRTEIGIEIGGEMRIRATVAKRTTNTRERLPLVPKKPSVKIARTSIRKIAMMIAVSGSGKVEAGARAQVLLPRRKPALHQVAEKNDSEH